MRAIGVDANHALDLFEVPDEPTTPGYNEVLVRTTRVGVCATDREIVETGAIFQLPEGEDRLILGHEASGTVAAVGEGVTSLLRGDTVVPVINKDRNRGIDSHGYFREQFTESTEHLVKVPDTVRDYALLIEPLTVSLHALTEANAIRAYRTDSPLLSEPSALHQRVLVIGAGPIGLLGTMLCRVWDYSVTTVDHAPDDSRKARIVTDSGASYVDMRQSTTEGLLTEGPYDLILSAAPQAGVLPQYLPLLARAGVFALVGWSGGQAMTEIDLACFIRDAIHREWTINGTVGARTEDFLVAADALGAMHERFGGALNELVTSIHAPEDFQTAFAHGRIDDLVCAIEFSEPAASP